MKKNKQFIKFLISLYKPVRFLTLVMMISMLFSQIAILFKQLVIKGLIDLPIKPIFGLNDLTSVIILLVGIIVVELILFYISNIVRTTFVLRKQQPYVSEYLFNDLNKKSMGSF